MTSPTTSQQIAADVTAPRIIAAFHPQAWWNDYAMEVDPEGPTEFDVTDVILAMSRDDAEAIRDDQYESDDLRFAPSAPQWVRDWSGPFWIEVENAIGDYFAAIEAARYPAPIR